ncbi:MAG: Universal stress protein family [Gammaproteobacteria bacterium]|nr:Universal stress protein family [Gammaproteobacteria bacterium]
MYQTILFCTDFCSHTPIIANKARLLAQQFGAKLYLVHVVPPIPSYGYSGSVDLQTISEEHGEKLLKDLAIQLHVPPEQAFIATGSTKQEILQIAKRVQANLIVLGSHGYHGLSSLLGSTANGVSHGALCDVLQIHVSD